MRTGISSDFFLSFFSFCFSFTRRLNSQALHVLQKVTLVETSMALKVCDFFDLRLVLAHQTSVSSDFQHLDGRSVGLGHLFRFFIVGQQRLSGIDGCLHRRSE